MIKEYLKSGFRVLLKNRVSTMINILGLSLGIASSLILFVVIQFELGYDSFHKNYDSIYRVTHIQESPNGTSYGPGIYYPMSKVLREEMPDLKPVAMIKMESDRTVSIIKNGEPILFKEDNIGFGEQEVFSIFDFDFLEGNKEKALVNPGSVVITREIAKKYFDGDAMGKEITVARELTAMVTGVIDDIPENTDFPFRFLFHFDDLEKTDQFYSKDRWNISNSAVQCYFVKPDNVNIDDIEYQILELIKKNRDFENQEVYCQPLTEIHFDDRFESLAKLPVSKNIILALGFIGLILILIACINFVNLETAQAIKRSKESGIRKVLGSTKFQLIGKYMLETSIITLTSILLSLGLAELSINEFKDFIQVERDVNLFVKPEVYIFLAVVFVFVTIVSGLYPSYVISRYNPSEVIKKNVSSGSSGFWSFRKTLVLAQFVISQLLIVSALIIFNQLNFFNSHPLGFDSEQILIVELPNTDQKSMEAFRNLAIQDSRIEDIGFAVGSPLSGNAFDSEFRLSQDSEDIRTDIKAIDDRYIDLYDLEIIAGTNIKVSDSMDKVLVNERLLESLPWNAEEAVGNEIYFGGEYREIAGVVKNFYNKSLQERSNSVLMIYFPEFFFQAGIKLTPGSVENFEQTVEQLNESWQQAYPGFYFDYQFLDTQIAEMYESQQMLARLINIFTFIAIFISALGLYGLILFAANQRTKEIGIRKVLGASVTRLMGSFILDFVILLALACIIAAPVSYFFMNNWLSNFTYRVEISLWIFGAAFLIGFLVAFITVGFRSYKASVANPVDALRNE